MFPSDFHKELIELKKRISARLNIEADRIVSEEVSKILGRVKILRQADLNSLQYDWFIEPQPTGQESK